MGVSCGRRAGVVAAMVGVAVVATPLWAQESRSGDRIIHRYFDSSQWFDSQSESSSGESGEDGGAGMEPARAERPEHQPGDAPGLWLSPGQDEWIWTSQGPVGPGQIEEPHGDLSADRGETVLDEETDRVDELDYQANFEPSVVPFKRGGVQNRIRRTAGGDYAAYLESGAFESVDVGGQAGSGDEIFWGSFLVRIDPSVRHSIASVAPEQRVLEVETEPRISLQIERDEAHNYFVSSDHEGMVRINLRLAVERRYFDGVMDRSVTWGDFDARRALPNSELRQQAALVTAMIGIDPTAISPAQALDRLVEYHREFLAREFPETAGDDRYVELSEEKVGVCRHRALTFMISARSLGFETHYVYNEAHAFVEVYWPGQGWRRIDLGGAADVFDYQNQSGGPVHDGIWDDEFARPDSYEDEMAQLSGDGDGGDGGQSEVSDERGEQSGDSLDDFDDDRFDEIEEFEQQMDAGRQYNEFEVDEEPRRQVEFLEADGEVFRGRTLHIRGRVEPAESETTVEVLLVPSGAQTLDQGVELGETTVEAGGYFDAEWTVPREVSLGRWRLRGRIVDEQ